MYSLKKFTTICAPWCSASLKRLFCCYNLLQIKHILEETHFLQVFIHSGSHCTGPQISEVVQARWAWCAVKGAVLSICDVWACPVQQDRCRGYLCLRPAWIRKRPRFLERSWLGRHTRQRERGEGVREEWKKEMWAERDLGPRWTHEDETQQKKKKKRGERKQGWRDGAWRQGVQSLTSQYSEQPL